VAKIQPTSGDVRRRYRRTLPGPEQRRAFDELGRLIDSPRDDLPWHHRVGELVGRLRPESWRGTRWTVGLAEALGPSPELLAKARRFAQLYPTQEAVRELEAMGVNWTRLYISFAVSDQEKRHALLRRAVDEGWSNQQLRFTVQQRFPSRRRGVGGRPRRPVTSHGPEVTLRELGRQCRRWLDFHEGGLAGGEGPGLGAVRPELALGGPRRTRAAPRERGRGAERGGRRLPGRPRRPGRPAAAGRAEARATAPGVITTPILK